jgi:hypothetical protein
MRWGAARIIYATLTLCEGETGTIPLLDSATFQLLNLDKTPFVGGMYDFTEPVAMTRVVAGPGSLVQAQFVLDSTLMSAERPDTALRFRAVMLLGLDNSDKVDLGCMVSITPF